MKLNRVRNKRLVWKRPSLMLASFFGTGFFPIAPATFATFVLYILIGFAGDWSYTPSVATLLGVIIFVTLIGVWASHRGEQTWGEDASPIVIDEVSGALITILGFSWSPTILLAGFFLFRFMDIVKPPPAYQIQVLPKGWGVMADDVVAGIYANIVLRIVIATGLLNNFL